MANCTVCGTFFPNPHGGTRRTCSDKCRILSWVEKQENGCWIFKKHTASLYSFVTINDRTKSAHRVSYEAFNGSIPKGLCICHKCDTPKCVNPEHLFLGTHKENAIDVAKIIEKVGFEVTDENDKPITFENTPDGVASYINEVLDAKRTEYAQAGVQQLIDKFPIVSDFLNYYVANGNSYEGFGQVRDRSTITIDENNTAQQEAIVREAFKESGKVGSIDDYISFLKSTNRLLDAAKQDLATLQENDKRVKAEQAEAAQRKIEEDKKAEIAYWGKVKSAIDKKEIAGYKIPETILINKNGKQSAATADDFFNYLYQVDDKGYSRYERELMETPEEEQLQNDLLRAYLKFTGGNYSNLVDLAIASEKTKTLRLKAAEQRRKSSIKITKPAANKKIGDNIADALGYV